MKTEDKARKRNTTQNKENWGRPLSVCLNNDYRAILDAICKRKDMNRSQTVRWLLLESERTKGE